jgi:hypothetical protein
LLAALGGGTSSVLGSLVAPTNVAARTSMSTRFTAASSGSSAGVGIPAWTPQAGELRSIATSNTFMSLAGDSLQGWGYRFGTIVDDFSGGVFNPYWGPFGALIFHGGGHSATYDNSVLILDFNDLTFKRLSNPSPVSTFTHEHEDPLFKREACEYADGQPGAGHTYDTLGILPPTDGGAPAGSLIRVSSHAVHVVISCNTAWAHRFDMTPRMSRGEWSRWSTNGPTSHRSAGGSSAYDSKRKRFWWLAGLSSLPPFVRYLDVASRQQRETPYARGAQRAPPAQPNSVTMRYDQARDILILSATVQGKLVLSYLLCAAPESGWFTANLSSEIPSRSGWSHPFDYVPQTDRFLMLAPADPTAVYEISLSNPPSSTWHVMRRAFSNSSAIPIAHVAGKRWSYSETAKAFVWLASSTAEVVAYRPVGT